MTSHAEIDELLATKVMGWERGESGWLEWQDVGHETQELVDVYCIYPTTSVNEEYAWHPTENIEQAFMVVDVLLRRQCEIRLRGMHWYDGGGWVVEVMDVFSKKVQHRAEDIVDWAEEKEPSLPMAICLAALSVIQQREDGK